MHRNNSKQRYNENSSRKDFESQNFDDDKQKSGLKKRKSSKKREKSSQSSKKIMFSPKDQSDLKIIQNKSQKKGQKTDKVNKYFENHNLDGYSFDQISQIKSEKSKYIKNGNNELILIRPFEHDDKEKNLNKKIVQDVNKQKSKNDDDKIANKQIPISTSFSCGSNDYQYQFQNQKARFDQNGHLIYLEKSNFQSSQNPDQSLFDKNIGEGGSELVSKNQLSYNQGLHKVTPQYNNESSKSDNYTNRTGKSLKKSRNNQNSQKSQSDSQRNKSQTTSTSKSKIIENEKTQQNASKLQETDAETNQEYKNLWLTDKFVESPGIVILVGTILLLILIAFCVAFETYIPSAITQRDLIDYSDIRTQMFDLREAAQGEIQQRQDPSGLIPLQRSENPNWSLVVAVECVSENCDNAITPRGLQLMDRIDRIIENDPVFQQVCLRHSDTNSTCADDPKPVGGTTTKASPLTIFRTIFGKDTTNITQYGIDFSLFGLTINMKNYYYALPLFSKDFNLTNRKAKMIRMVIFAAGPIEVNGIRYKTMMDRIEDQEYFVANWQNDLAVQFNALQASEFPEFKIHVFGRAYVYRAFYRQLLYDVLFAVISCGLVYFYTTFHVKSVFISSTAMLLILISFPVALVIYKLIFRISNLSSLHLMIVFVVLGVAVDNIFVIWDAWTQSEQINSIKNDQKKRMAYTFRRAAHSISATSSTTAFAFLSNGFSSLMPLSAFGYFCFVVVPVNFALQILYWPAFIIVYENKVKQIEKNAFQCLKDFFTCKFLREFCPLFIKSIKRKIKKLRKSKETEQVSQIQITQKGNSDKDSYSQSQGKSQKNIIIDDITSQSTNMNNLSQKNGGILQMSNLEIKKQELEKQNALSTILDTKNDYEQDSETMKEGGNSMDENQIQSNSSEPIQFSRQQPQGDDLGTMESFSQESQTEIQNRVDISFNDKDQRDNETLKYQSNNHLKAQNQTLSTSYITSTSYISSKRTQSQNSYKKPVDTYNSIERFFMNQWFNFINTFKWLIILLGIGLTVYSGLRTSEIGGLTEMEQYFGSNHYIQQAFKKTLFQFNEGEQAQTITVDIMWGVKAINKNGVDFFNASQIGTAIWDDQFDVSPPENQIQVYGFCQNIKKMDNILYLNNSIICWIEDFGKFLNDNNQRFPYIAADPNNQMKEFTQWVIRFLSETKIGQDHKSLSRVGIVDQKIVYMKFTAKSKGGIYDPYFLKNPIYERWQEILQQFNAKANYGVNQSLQTAGLDWCLMIMEIQLVSSMYQGLYISIAFALFALLCATGNIIQAILAAFTIGLVIVNVMAFVAYNKWQLGSAECVSIVVCVGFAVDYVVHLASHYVHSEFDDRENRMRDSLREMGISILSGAITTILATVTLFICVLMLFSKFAIFVIMTTLFSVAYSLGFFSALCLAIGPTGTQGDIMYYYYCCKDFIISLTGKQNQNTKDQEFNALENIATDQQTEIKNTEDGVNEYGTHIIPTEAKFDIEKSQIKNTE